jgi:hypothetical protein
MDGGRFPALVDERRPPVGRSAARFSGLLNSRPSLEVRDAMQTKVLPVVGRHSTSRPKRVS